MTMELIFKFDNISAEDVNLLLLKQTYKSLADLTSKSNSQTIWLKD